MYWYFKYPLIALLALLAVGVCHMVWRSLPSGLTQTVTAPVGELLRGAPEAPAPTPATPGTAADADTAAEAAVSPPTPPPKPPPAQPESATPATVRESAETATVPAPKPADRPQTAPPSPAAAEGSEAQRSLAKARQQAEGYNYLAARQLAIRVLTLPGVVEFDRTWHDAAELINRINTVFMSSGTASPERRAYTVQPGDSLSRIAQRVNTTVGALQRLNGLDPTNPVIYPGNVLYTLDVNWAVRVVKSKYVLLVLNGKELYRLYRIGVGRENKTPVGTFTISSKVIHPAWTPPGRTFPYGHPENPLGTHWLGLTPCEGTDPTLTGYGLHGTWEPETIGSAASEGCVRMRNDQVRELFDFIPEPGRGAAVRVVIED
jgi:lipoprotein-anchoring transpeptidase ErfK/SrfK